ncbi:MAG: hypothetical protein NTV00_03820 [Methylococcales bacterium]|nr:hypothetical protein [Methylococcales bacterium]
MKANKTKAVMADNKKKIQKALSELCGSYPLDEIEEFDPIKTSTFIALYKLIKLDFLAEQKYDNWTEFFLKNSYHNHYIGSWCLAVLVAENAILVGVIPSIENQYALMVLSYIKEEYRKKLWDKLSKQHGTPSKEIILNETLRCSKEYLEKVPLYYEILGELNELIFQMESEEHDTDICDVVISTLRYTLGISQNDLKTVIHYCSIFRHDYFEYYMKHISAGSLFPC